MAESTCADLRGKTNLLSQGRKAVSGASKQKTQDANEGKRIKLASDVSPAVLEAVGAVQCFLHNYFYRRLLYTRFILTQKLKWNSRARQSKILCESKWHSPGRVAQLAGALSCPPEVCGFYPQSGHIPACSGRVAGSVPGWGAYGRHLIVVSVSHRCFSPPPPHRPKINTHILG